MLLFPKGPLTVIVYVTITFRFLCAILSALIPVISTELQPDISFPIIYGLRWSIIVNTTTATASTTG